MGIELLLVDVAVRHEGLTAGRLPAFEEGESNGGGGRLLISVSRRLSPATVRSMVSAACCSSGPLPW